LIFEILLVLLLIVINGLLALAEIAVVSARRVRLQQRAESGDVGARRALELAAEPTRFLSTIQIGITLIGILAGAFSGATLADYLAAVLIRVPALAPYAEAISVGVVVVIITYLSLVIGELLPKRIALSNPDQIAARVARPMQLLSKFTAPAVSLLSASTEVLIRLLGIRSNPEPPVTVEEINILLKQGESVGIFEPTEQDIVRSTLYLDELRVSALVTPRPEVVWLNLDAALEINLATITSSPHAYFPAAHSNLDNVVGVIRGRDMLAQKVLGWSVDLPALVRPTTFVPESQSVLEMLKLFKQSDQHMMLVIDEFGGLLGLVTLTDILEAVVGNLRSPGLPDDPLAVQREDGSWLLDGRMPVHELKELLDLTKLPEEPNLGYETLGGLMMTMLSRIPKKGDFFEYAQHRFEVMDMDGKRVDQVLVSTSLSQTPEEVT
jgi:putative hemolysin